MHLLKKIKPRMLACLFLLFALLGIGCGRSKLQASQQELFDKFINDLFVKEVQSDTLSLNYTLAHPEAYGINLDEPTLGEYTVEYIGKKLLDKEQYLNELLNFNYDLLSADRQLTYDVLRHCLELELRLGDYIYYWEALGPTTGIQAQLPILLAEYHFYDRGDIEDYLKLLPCVKKYFDDVAEFEREKSRQGLFMPDAAADRIIAQCEAFIADPEENYLIEYFNDKIDSFAGLSKAEKADYKRRNRQAVLDNIIPSYELLADTLKELKGTGINNAGLYYYPEGQAYYELLVRLKTGSDKSMSKIIEMLETTIGSCIIELTRQTMSDPMIFDKFDSFESFPLTDPEAILEDLKVRILEDFPEPEDVNCEIKYVHESLEEYLSPALYLIPAIDNYSDNYIYINGSDEETLATIYTTVAHEGYPGHLYQNVYFRSKNNAPIRNLLSFAGYDEGWATYVEFYSYRYCGIDRSLADVLSLNSKLILMMYARADIGIHYEGWDKQKAMSYIGKFTGDETIACRIYRTLLEEPAIYLPYAIGYLEIMELRVLAEDTLGPAFNIKEFHEFLLDIGPAHFGAIRQHLESWLETKTDLLAEKQ